MSSQIKSHILTNRLVIDNLHEARRFKMSLFKHARKPEGFVGKIMLSMMNSGHTPMAKWGIQYIEIAEDATVLDIGCGGGGNLKRLLEIVPKGKVTGIDYSEVSVEKSRNLNKKDIAAGRCAVLDGNVLELPFVNDTFDLITAFETIYFWPDIPRAFAEVYKALKPDGTFAICNEVSDRTIDGKKWEKRIPGMTIYSAKEMRDYLQQAGFEKIKAHQNNKNWLCILGQK